MKNSILIDGDDIQLWVDSILKLKDFKNRKYCQVKLCQIFIVIPGKKEQF